MTGHNELLYDDPAMATGITDYHNRVLLGNLSTTIKSFLNEEAGDMELDPTVIPIGAEVRSQDGELIGRAREVHTRYLVIEDLEGLEVEISVEAIRQIEGKRVFVDNDVIKPE